MESLRMFVRSMLGPRLFQVFTSGAHQHIYQANGMERMGDNVLRCLAIAYSVAYYTWPLVIPYLYRRGTLDPSNLGYFVKLFSVTGGFYVIGYGMRGAGRMTNPEYCEMLAKLKAAWQEPSNLAAQKALLRYDISLELSPANFQAKRTSFSPPAAGSALYRLGSSLLSPYEYLKYMFASVLGRAMMYPGSTRLINIQLSDALMFQRHKMITTQNGQRCTIGTIDGNNVDAMFFDRRAEGCVNGDTLVLVSDGNAAFYEVGGTVVCIQSGFSVLGWNHPGFGASTGLPFPTQEQNAVEAVYQYAVEVLGFTPGNILLYSWSIGGYASSYLAQHHADISGVILDATFDDVIPLANLRMPASISWFVESIVRGNLHLNNAERINEYNGPLTIVRRSNDEMMMTDGSAASNRGNFLFTTVFRRRFPKLMCQATEDYFVRILSQTRPSMGVGSLSDFSIDVPKLLLEEIRRCGTDIPSSIGEGLSDNEKVALSALIAENMLQHHSSTHCVPLPVTFIRPPWSLASGAN